MNSVKLLDFNKSPVYSGRKSTDGFYCSILQSIYSILEWSRKKFNHPKAVHFVVDQPIPAKIKRISEFLARWQQQRSTFNEKDTQNPLFVYAIEKKPKKLTQHLHLMIVLEDCNFADLMDLRDALTYLSLARSVKMYKRRDSDRPLVLDEETGEIKIDENGLPVRRGSRHYHRVKSEFEDCFLRFSYLAKAFSKSVKPEWSASRLGVRIKESVSQSMELTQ